MAPKARDIEQNLFDDILPPIRVLPLTHSELNNKVLDGFLSPPPKSIGLSWGTNPESASLQVLAMATSTRVLLVALGGKAKAKGGEEHLGSPGTILIRDRVLCRGDDHRLFAFDFGPLACMLFDQYNLRVQNGIDIQDCCKAKDRSPLKCLKFAAGDVPVYVDNVTSAFNSTVFDVNDPLTFTATVLRAWAAQHVGNLDAIQDQVYEVAPIDTSKLSNEHMQYIAKLARDSLEMDSRKPETTTQRLQASASVNADETAIELTRFQSRLRQGQRVRVTVDSGAHSYTTYGPISKSQGRFATMQTQGVLQGTVTTTVLGRDGPTNAEATRAATLLRALQGDAGMFSNPWWQAIWTTNLPGWPTTAATPAPPVVMPSYPMNQSQLIAVNKMLDVNNDSRITIIQGPPGTGKTTVIATYVISAIAGGAQGIWLTAQSNVAVRNIAEKLSDMGFSSWRLLVSKDFHLGWHEHLYTEIAPRIIRSDDFKPATARELLKGCQVILCTLSMLSNKRLRDCKYTQIVPFNILVVDEASQVEIGDYVPIITTFATSLSKICFIGDDKQLPPFGEEDIGGLKSIFEVSHLRQSIHLLDIQYRMPPQLGDFISSSIYDHKLLSNPNHPIKSSVPSCFFIDVKSGKEQPSLKSTVNKQEQEAVCILAARFLEEDRSFKIITPYDAQRSALEELLKQKNLAWQDKCFNIDSFQGNEDDYIIISLVRTAALGFLDNPRRTNVMFTRCKRGMYICCNSNFVGGKAKDTLVGQMAEAFGEEAWIDWDDLVNGDF